MAEESSSAVVTGELLPAIPDDERTLRGLELAERYFPAERRAQIAAFLEVPPEHPALMPYLAWCSSMGLSPIAGHVWLIPKKIKAVPARDGQEGQPERVIYKPAIGRDGLLHKARETKGQRGGYKGMTFDVVCERDVFEVERSIDPDVPPNVLHRHASKPTIVEPGVAADRWRGRILGAWACCYVQGEPPTFYYAPLREHGRRRQVWDWNPNAHKRAPLYLDVAGKMTWAEFDGEGMRNRPMEEWEGAWSYTSSMVLKAAQSYVLRIALGVTGVVPVDELRIDASEWSAGDEPRHTVTHPPVAEAFDFSAVTEDAELRDRLQAAVNRANELEAFSWAPARCEMVMAGRTPRELAAIAGEIERENELRESRAAAVDASAVEEPEPVAPESDVVERHGELSPDDQQAVDVLRARRAQIEARRFSASEEQQGEIVAELDQIDAELSKLLGPEAVNGEGER